MLKLPPKRDNQIEALLKYSQKKHSLGEEERNLRVKIKEAREGRIYSDIEKENVFKPLSTSINKVLKEGLFTKDAKGDYTIPRLGNSPFVNPSDISNATKQLMIEDDEFRLPEGFSIEEVNNVPVVVIDGIERIVKLFQDTKYRAGFMDLENNSNNDNFMGVGDVNLKDFQNGLLTLSIDEDGAPLELNDGTTLNKVPMSKGLMSLFFPREVIQKNGLRSVITEEDVKLYTEIIKEIINQNASVRNEILSTSAYKSSLKYKFVLNKANIEDIRNIPLEKGLEKEQRENTGMTQKELDKVWEKIKSDPDAVKKVFENALILNLNIPSNKEFDDQKMSSYH